MACVGSSADHITGGGVNDATRVELPTEFLIQLRISKYESQN